MCSTCVFLYRSFVVIEGHGDVTCVHTLQFMLLPACSDICVHTCTLLCESVVWRLAVFSGHAMLGGFSQAAMRKCPVPARVPRFMLFSPACIVMQYCSRQVRAGQHHDDAATIVWLQGAGTVGAVFLNPWFVVNVTGVLLPCAWCGPVCCYLLSWPNRMHAAIFMTFDVHCCCFVRAEPRQFGCTPTEQHSILFFG